MLGKLEEMILIAAIRAGEGATGADIHEVLCRTIGKEKSFGSIWTTLNRMVTKNYLKAQFMPGDNGKQRKHFSLTGLGHSELNDNLVATKSLLRGSGLKPAVQLVVGWKDS